jgi:LmbE family N-acetylglucosaminyl deacetylase
MITRKAAARVVTAATTGWRRRLTARAVDATDLLPRRRLVVLAPHPDDETFGCGALIARTRDAGFPVTVVVATDGAHSTASRRLSPPEIAALRRTELRAACARLGVDDLVELGHPDGTLGHDIAGLAGELAAVCRDRQAETVLVTCAQDQHPDHQALNRAAYALDVPLLLGYPVWCWQSAPAFLDAPAGDWPGLWLWAVREAAAGRWWRVPTGPYLRHKREAVAAYPTQTTNWTGEPEWSHLPDSFITSFLGSDELFLPLRPATARR